MAADDVLIDAPDEAAAEEQTEGQEIPSVFSVINRHLVGAADVSDPAPDGSRMLRLYSANGQSVIEAALAPQLCEFLAGKLMAVRVITEDEEPEDDSDAGTAEK